MINGGVVGKGGEEGVGRVKVVEGAGDRASIGAGDIGGSRMDAQDHVVCLIDLATIRMGRDKAKEEFKARDGGEGGGRLFRGEGASRSEDASVHAPPVVQEVAHGYLQLLELGGKCQAQWGTGGSGIRRRVVYRGWGKLQGEDRGGEAG